MYEQEIEYYEDLQEDCEFEGMGIDAEGNIFYI